MKRCAWGEFRWWGKNFVEASKLVMRTAASRVGGAVWSRMKFRKRTRRACDDSGGEKGGMKHFVKGMWIGRVKKWGGWISKVARGARCTQRRAISIAERSINMMPGGGVREFHRSTRSVREFYTFHRWSSIMFTTTALVRVQRTNCTDNATGQHQRLMRVCPGRIRPR